MIDEKSIFLAVCVRFEVFDIRELKSFLQQFPVYFFHKTLKSGLFKVSVHITPYKIRQF